MEEQSETRTVETAFVDLKRRVIHAEDRLIEIKTELVDLNSCIRRLNDTITESSKPHYQTWIAAGTLFCTVTAAVWWLAINPISERLRVQEAVSATVVSRDVHIQKWADSDRDMQRLQNEIDSRATKDDLNRLIIDLDQRLLKSRSRG